MRNDARARYCLYGSSGGRKYLNIGERRRFARATKRAATDVRLFCLTLYFCGGRISEVLALTPATIDLDANVIVIRTLKRRQAGIMRQVPLPRTHLAEMNRYFHIRKQQRDPVTADTRLWRWSRTTAYRRVKEVMVTAGVSASAAMPKGLRHGFGVNATASRVPQHLIQRWLGHASPETTAIYCDVCGPDERQVASRMWRRDRASHAV